MGESERIELSNRDLQKIASLMGADFKAEINSFLSESFEIQSIRSEKKYDTILTIFKDEVVETISLQNEEICKIKLDNIEIRKEMDELREALPIVNSYIRLSKNIKFSIKKAIMWITIGFLFFCLTCRVTKIIE
jgi:DNA polymerase III delta prime subunit